MLVTEARLKADSILNKGRTVRFYKEVDNGYLFYFGSQFIGVFVDSKTGKAQMRVLKDLTGFTLIPGMSMPSEELIG